MGVADGSPTVCSTSGTWGGERTIVFASTRSSAVLYVLTKSDIGGRRSEGTPVIDTREGNNTSATAVHTVLSYHNT